MIQGLLRLPKIHNKGRYAQLKLKLDYTDFEQSIQKKIDETHEETLNMFWKLMELEKLPGRIPIKLMGKKFIKNLYGKSVQAVFYNRFGGPMIYINKDYDFRASSLEEHLTDSTVHETIHYLNSITLPDFWNVSEQRERIAFAGERIYNLRKELEKMESPELRKKINEKESRLKEIILRQKSEFREKMAARGIK